MLPWHSQPYPATENQNKMENTNSSDYVCIEPENCETVDARRASSDEIDFPSMDCTFVFLSLISTYLYILLRLFSYIGR